MLLSATLRASNSIRPLQRASTLLAHACPTLPSTAATAAPVAVSRSLRSIAVRMTEVGSDAPKPGTDTIFGP